SPVAGQCAVKESPEAVSAIQPQLVRFDTMCAPTLDSERESNASEHMLESNLEGEMDRVDEAEELMAALELTGMPDRDLSLRRSDQAHFAGKKEFLSEGLVAEQQCQQCPKKGHTAGGCPDQVQKEEQDGGAADAWVRALMEAPRVDIVEVSRGLSLE